MSPREKKLKRGFPKEVREAVARAQRGFCRICTKALVDFHHRVPNTDTNRKLFPTFIKSIFNCIGLCRTCHSYKKHEVAITLDEAVEYEQYLTAIETNVFKELYCGTETKLGETSIQETETTMS